MAKKNVEPVEPITLREIAEEMNEVMAYGTNEDGELVAPEELIDVDQKEKALLAEIKKRAAEDLRPDDENQFTKDAWDWFIDNGITPGNGDSEPDEVPAPKSKAKAKPAEKEDKKSSKSKDSDDEKRGIKKAMIPGGNVKKAEELAKEGCSLEDFVDEFTKIYKAAGNNDKTYAAARAKIYYGIGYKNIGKTPPSGGKEAPKGKSSKVKDEPAPKGRGRARDAEPEVELEDEVPKGRGRARR